MVKRRKKRNKPKRVYQRNMWKAGRLYHREAQRAHKAGAYFCAVVARACEMEALLRLFDILETKSPKDRCHSLSGLINRAFKKHWIPHDALRWWKQAQRVSFKECLHEVREARNGVHAHLFDKKVFTRRTSSNVSYIVEQVWAALKIKNDRNLMFHLYQRGDITPKKYWAWRRMKRLK